MGAESLCLSQKPFEEFLSLKCEDNGSGNCRRICWLLGKRCEESPLLLIWVLMLSAVGVCDTDSDYMVYIAVSVSFL